MAVHSVPARRFRVPKAILMPRMAPLAALSLAIGLTLFTASQTFGQTPTAIPFTVAEIDAARAAFVAGDFSVIETIAIPAAEAGDASAQNLLAIAYQFGSGVPHSERLAREWYERAAEQGLARAQMNLSSSIVADPKATDADYALALRFALAAAEQGNAPAYGVLTNIFQYGLGVPPDGATAASYARRGAEAGHANSMLQLAHLLYDGEFVPADHPSARGMFGRAASGGAPNGYFYLGLMQANGEGGAVDLDGALSSYTAALSAGVAQAPFALADLYRGHPDHFKDRVAGLSMCYLALRLEEEANLDRVMLECADWAGEFTPEQNASARDFAAAYDVDIYTGPPDVALEPVD